MAKYTPLYQKLLPADALDEILSASRNDKFEIVSFLNPFSYRIMRRKRELASEVDYWFSDGQLLCLAHNMVSSKKISRLSFDFSSAADRIFRFCEETALPIAFIGGTASEIVAASDFIRESYNSITMSFFETGFFPPEKEDSIIINLLDSNPKIVVIGLGTPKQEHFAAKLRNAAKARPCNNGLLIFTCGAFLSQTASSGDYYPLWAKKYNMRWVYRAIRERHVRRRIMKDYPLFWGSFLGEAIRTKFTKVNN